jgi:hypothetical protein
MRKFFAAFGELPPLRRLLILALAVRLFSVVFSKGFGWHDDHFLIIEASQSWADDFDYNYWLPDPADPSRQPHGHSLTYVGLHYFFFEGCEMIGLDDPQLKMTIVRLFHALWSLLIIVYGWRIVLRHAGEKTAWYAGLLLALYWFMPFMSVRNLAEFVCVPPLLFAVDRIDRKNQAVRDYLLAGLMLGIACSFRFQSVFMVAGIGLGTLLLQRKVLHVVVLILSCLAVIFITQGLVDYIIWRKPFAEFLSYVQYNLDNAGAYGTDNWHMYFDLVLGLLVPPLSIVLVAGYFTEWRRLPLLFWPVLIYLAFHTWFPNKQERFVMTPLPFLIIAGAIGAWHLWVKKGNRMSAKAVSASMWFVICLNMLLLLLFTPSYSKRHRVESMYYLYKKGNSSSFIVEDSNKDSDFLMPPLFYYGKWFSVPGITKNFTADSVRQHLEKHPLAHPPDHVVFWQAENLETRVAAVKKVFPTLEYDTTIVPSLIDRILYRLNPLNDNQTAYIYRIGPSARSEHQ